MSRSSAPAIRELQKEAADDPEKFWAKEADSGRLHVQKGQEGRPRADSEGGALRHGVTGVFMAPTDVRLLMRYGTESAKRVNLSSLGRVFSAGEVLNPPALKWLRRLMGPVAVIGEINFVSMLPKTRSGKIMRRVLKAVTLDRDPGDISTIEDEGSVEETRQAWIQMKTELSKPR